MPRQFRSALARRVTYALLFEGIGLLITTLGLMALSGHDAHSSGGAAIGSTVLALLYNTVFNWAFEAWERHQPVRGRSLKRRLAHGILFEGGLVLVLVPFLAWWLQIGLVEALFYDAALVAAFAVYTFVFTWGFDRLFGLPESAR